MAEYIKKEDIEQKIQDGLNNLVLGHDAIEVLGMIYEMPAADVAPVRHGHWISLTECANEGVYCSICKKKVWKSDYALCSKKSRNKLRSNYCPHCGSIMDLEEAQNGKQS